MIRIRRDLTDFLYVLLGYAQKANIGVRANAAFRIAVISASVSGLQGLEFDASPKSPTCFSEVYMQHAASDTLLVGFIHHNRSKPLLVLSFVIVIWVNEKNTRLREQTKSYLEF